MKMIPFLMAFVVCTAPLVALDTDSWDLTSLYPSLDAWEHDFQRVCGGRDPFKVITDKKGTLRNGPAAIKEVFDSCLALERSLEKLATWAHHSSDAEMTVESIRSAYSRIQSMWHLFGQATSWIDSEILSLSDEQLDTLLKSPVLAEHRLSIERLIRMKPHTLNEREEALLALANEPFGKSHETFDLFNDADLQFGSTIDGQGCPHSLTHASYGVCMQNPDRILRKNAFQTVHNKYKEFENTLSALLAAQVQRQVFHARSRNFASSVDVALYPKNIPTTVYTNLLDTVRSEISAYHDYLDLRAKVLGVDELHVYDMSAPMFPECIRTYTFDEACQLVIESVAPLGAEYQQILARGLTTQGWVDRYEKKNKCSGAYSGGCYDSHPYILMNFKGRLQDVFTLAHEAGHSMHSYYSRLKQPFQTSSYSIFVAEVASTFNEELLLQHLLKKATSVEEKAYLISHKLDDIRSTLFRQTMFAEFEKRIHDQAESRLPLTPAFFKTTYFNLCRDYFGPRVVVDDEIQYEWARVPHFYSSFYVYQYATGISAALALADDVLASVPGAQCRYLAFLSSGSSKYPIQLLKDAGVDMESPEVIQKAIMRFRNLTKQLKQELYE